MQSFPDSRLHQLPVKVLDFWNQDASGLFFDGSSIAVKNFVRIYEMPGPSNAAPSQDLARKIDLNGKCVIRRSSKNSENHYILKSLLGKTCRIWSDLLFKNNGSPCLKIYINSNLHFQSLTLICPERAVWCIKRCWAYSPICAQVFWLVGLLVIRLHLKFIHIHDENQDRTIKKRKKPSTWLSELQPSITQPCAKVCSQSHPTDQPPQVLIQAWIALSRTWIVQTKKPLLLENCFNRNGDVKMAAQRNFLHSEIMGTFASGNPDGKGCNFWYGIYKRNSEYKTFFLKFRNTEKMPQFSADEVLKFPKKAAQSEKFVVCHLNILEIPFTTPKGEAIICNSFINLLLHPQNYKPWGFRGRGYKCV
ncbi:hypothetical protein VP01_1857g1 [Puccinia sorghi]|uniref:Uncharacterized protein n=1 Tax=Puccinia sorghi TaxID=27349 RepID=A0A0L6VDJ2_9BASI|nr:hypothetical protein VP01_1857g1 [Puccinia sorghi]